MSRTMIEIHPLTGLGEVVQGDDLGELFAGAMAPLGPHPGDVLVVTSKVVSKAEGRAAALAGVVPGSRARDIAAALGKDARLVELVLGESAEVLRAERGVLITRHRLGLVMANAGIDCSNTGPNDGERALLLPLDPDGSAQSIAAAVARRTGVAVAVVISDSFGRPWRHGVVNVAVGCAGLPAVHDKRGERDRDGRVLQATQVAYGDLIASAAGLAMGEAEEGVPAALVRGLLLPPGDAPAAALIRAVDEDLFR
ncbi:MAG: coenzyme F420-0:L-glutamate ligase [Novosphingobium sp.]